MAVQVKAPMEIKLYSFRQITPTTEDWELIESAYDSTVFHSRKWNQYIERIGYRPFVLEVYKDEEKIGFFLGERLWRGTHLVAAPFEGLGTYTQGLVLSNAVPANQRIEIYRCLADYLFNNRIARYFQVDDWQLREDSCEWEYERTTTNRLLSEMNLRYEVRPTLYISLDRSIDDLWSGLHYKSCKYCINKARKLGLEIRSISNKEEIPEFVKIHYEQLKEVCNRKGMKPKAAQGKDRMLALCEELFPDRVLMLEVVGNDELGAKRIMSTGIFCIDKGECSYWTGASFQRYQKYCPNELMVWEAMRLLNERGAGDLNFCGMARYKLKFGTIYAYVPRLIFTKSEVIYKLKNLAKQLYHKSRKLLN